jgi:hypothetical protein
MHLEHRLLSGLRCQSWQVGVKRPLESFSLYLRENTARVDMMEVLDLEPLK